MKTRFNVNHRARFRFVKRGLRNYFEYRDLGIRRATRCKVVAHVIRARPGKAPHGQWHRHDCDVQFVYVLKGWAVFEYEGVGRVRMTAGTCFYQPPGIRHREIRRPLRRWRGTSPSREREVAPNFPPASRGRWPEGPVGGRGAELSASMSTTAPFDGSPAYPTFLHLLQNVIRCTVGAS